jgi:hypothetical protein
MSLPEVSQPFNYDAAKQLLESTQDPILRNVLMFAMAQLQLHLVPIVGTDEAEWRRNLPMEPFDTAFFLKVVRSIFTHRDVLEKLLAGKTTAQATGWDIFE